MQQSSFTISHALPPDEAVTRINVVLFHEMQRELGDNVTNLRQEWRGSDRQGTFKFQAMGKPVTVYVSLLDGKRVKFDFTTVQEMGIILPRIEREIRRQAEIFLN